MIRFDLDGLTRRKTLLALASGLATLASPLPLLAVPDGGFARWVANFRARAVARGISEKTYDRVMNAVTPDKPPVILNPSPVVDASAQAEKPPEAKKKPPPKKKKPVRRRRRKIQEDEL